MNRSHSRSSYPLDKLLPFNGSKDSYEHRDDPTQVHNNYEYFYTVHHVRWCGRDVEKKLHKKKQRQYNRTLERNM